MDGAQGNEGAADRANRRSAASALLVMSCTAASRLFGYVRQYLFGYYFGAAGDADALNAVFNIPNNLRKLFAEGAFSSAFIPVLSSTIAEDGSRARAKELVRTLVALELLVLLPLVILSVAFPRLFVSLLFDFSDPGTIDLAARLMRWTLNYVLFVSLGAVVMAVLNTHERFAIPALSPLMFTAAAVVSLIFFHGNLGILAMGVGVLVGGALQLTFQLPAFRAQGYRLIPSFRFSNPDFVKTARLWLPYLAAASIPAITQQVAQYFASGLEKGSVSAVTNAVMFLQVPIGVFTTSVTTVVFPRMSRQAALGETEELRSTLSYSVELLLPLLIPSTVLLCLFGREIIAAAMQRGRFDTQATLMASGALTGYACGLAFMGVYTVLQKLFNSLKSLAIPLASAAIIAVVDIVFSLVLKETPLRVSGLAYANSIAFLAGMLFLWVVARRRLGKVPLRPIWRSLWKSSLGALPMTALLLLFLRSRPELWRRGGSLREAALIVAVVLACAALTLASYGALRVSFVTELLRRRKRRAAQ